MQSSYVIDKLKQNGRILVRVKGSHHVFTHPDSPLTIKAPQKPPSPACFYGAFASVLLEQLLLVDALFFDLVSF